MTRLNRIAVAGAAGNTGAAVIQALSSSAFEVTVLSRSPPNATAADGPVKTIQVDYLSQESLVAALQGQDAVVVCGVGMLPEQTNLVDAAIKAKVSRFIPADFSGDFEHPALCTLPIFQDKVATLAYLRKHESKLSWTTIKTGPLFDYCLNLGVLVNMRERAQMLYDSGDQVFSTTTTGTAGRAVAAVLKAGDKFATRAVYVQDLRLTQNRLRKVAEELVPGEAFKIMPFDTSVLAAKAAEVLKSDPTNPMAIGMQRGVSVFGPDAPADFGEADNEALGIKMMDENGLRDVLRTFL